MAEHKENEFTEERYPGGAPKITGKCAICGEKKVLVSKKNPTCQHCRKIKAGKSTTNAKGPRQKAAAPAEACVFSVDLGSCPEVVEKLQQRAAEQFRTIEAQIAWELKENIL